MIAMIKKINSGAKNKVVTDTKKMKEILLYHVFFIVLLKEASLAISQERSKRRRKTK